MSSSLFIGVMSGTSADGIDAVLAAFEGERCRERGHVHRPFERSLRNLILDIARGSSLADAATLDVRLADAYAEAIETLLQQTGISRRRIRAIGCHGQTVLHRPEGTDPTSIQLGDPHRLAAQCGIDVVNDFRRADIAAGGEGAPLACGFHAATFTSREEDRCVANIGGMANVTVLPAGSDSPAAGFDTGPGNVLLDGWISMHGGSDYDADGTWAARGDVDTRLLAALRSEPWFRRAPPKSTGREHFGQEWLERWGGDRLQALDPADVQATLAELTAATLADAIQTHAPGTTRVLICGGGARNTDLLSRLSRLLPDAAVETTAMHGIDPGHVEALAFAWLARRRLRGQPGNCPAVTGAHREVPLGAVILAPKSVKKNRE